MIPLEDVVIRVLEQALRRGSSLSACITCAQNLVWDHEALPSDNAEVWEILRQLAYDLDYFEPDSKLRAHDPSYFGEDRARAEIQTALKSLNPRR